MDVRSRPLRVRPRHPRPGSVAGVDVGLIDALVMATGEEAPARHAAPNRTRPSKAAAVKRLVAQRQKRLVRSRRKAKLAAAIAARTVPGPLAARDVQRAEVRYSRRQERLSRSISRLIWREADRRDDFLHKASTAVVRSAEVVVVETLNLDGLLSNHHLARSLSEAALARLLGMMRCKTEKLGGLVLPAPRFFSSTRRCAACGAVNTELTLKDRSWTCTSCETVRDRDGNAADNLRQLGFAAVMDGPVPKGLERWTGWVEDARASESLWRTDRDGSDDAGRGGSLRSGARGEGPSGRARERATAIAAVWPRLRQGSPRRTANQNGSASARSRRRSVLSLCLHTATAMTTIGFFRPPRFSASTHASPRASTSAGGMAKHAPGRASRSTMQEIRSTGPSTRARTRSQAAAIGARAAGAAAVKPRRSAITRPR
ncbi:RNA-guided endonuclease InsQ/TnpB family protein [Lichenibacterium dinghuense]|uniref:RNA-guided endonuclease InsQ/TnpB family protein n=1 Tax=Lichenibacterium dinghuense TaxID=2895977 RepID=UPI0028163C1A|nr:transposase [Lichenibacterium sp. 6Y81]